MFRVALVLMLLLLSQSALAVLEGSHVHLTEDGANIEHHVAGSWHDVQEHEHENGETCAHHHCVHYALDVTPFIDFGVNETKSFHYLRRDYSVAPNAFLRPPKA